MIRVNNFVLVITDICNLRCRHCYLSCGSAREGGGFYEKRGIMSVAQAQRYIEQLSAFKGIVKKVHIAGGEISLFKDNLKEIVFLLKKHKLPVSIVTNCSWAKDQKRAEDFVRCMSEQGVGQMQLSVSRFHQEFLDIGHAIRAVQACKKFGVEAVLRPLVTDEDNADDVIKNIPDNTLKGIIINPNKCNSIGRAGEEISKKEFSKAKLPYYGCFPTINLTIRSDGSVYPCCCGSETTKALCLGNLEKESLRDIITRAELDPLLGILFFQGPKYLSEILYQQGGKDFRDGDYSCICDMCNALFSDEDIVRDLRRATEAYIHDKHCELLRSGQPCFV